MLNIIIFGPPGAGKGTQAEITAEKFKLFHLSSGEILRSAAKKPELEKEINSYLSSGRLVPDNLIIKMVNINIDKKIGQQGIIFDGYPRTIKQAKYLDATFEKKDVNKPIVLNLNLEEESAISRILSRGKNSERSDDNAKVIKERFKVYHKQTEPLLDYYREKGRLIDIDGEVDIEGVSKNIIVTLKELEKSL